MTAFVVTYTGYAEDVKVLRTVDKRMAKAVAASLPSNRMAFAVESAADISSIALTGALVLKLYNVLAEKPVQKFENRQTGHERFVRLLTDRFGNVELTETDLTDDGIPPPTETQRDSDPKAQTSEPTMEEGAEDMAGKKNGKAAKAKAPKTGRTRRDANAKITLLVKENPKRKGTESCKRYDKYKSGMTVAEALKAGITPADLSYDVKHGNIKIAG